MFKGVGGIILKKSLQNWGKKHGGYSKVLPKLKCNHQYVAILGHYNDIIICDNICQYIVVNWDHIGKSRFNQLSSVDVE